MIKLTYVHWNTKKLEPIWVSYPEIMWMKTHIQPSVEGSGTLETTILNLPGYNLTVKETPEEIMKAGGVVVEATS